MTGVPAFVRGQPCAGAPCQSGRGRPRLGERFHEWCHLEHQVFRLAGCGCIFLHVGPDDNGVRAGFQRLEHRHGGLHAKGSRDIAASRDDSALSAAHDDGLVGEGGVVPLFDGGVEGVAVDVGDREAFRFRRAASCAGCGRSGSGAVAGDPMMLKQSRHKALIAVPAPRGWAWRSPRGSLEAKVSMRAWACGLGRTRLASRVSATKCRRCT